VYTSSSSGVCQSSHNPKLDITDSWVESNSDNESNADDGRLFVGETVYPISSQLRESTDMICYDFDGDGDYDACYFDSNGCVNGAGCSASSCNVSGFTIPQSVSSSKKWSCDIDSGNGCKIGVDNGTPAQICTGSSCSISTATPIYSNEIRAVGFTDCDNSDSLKGQYTINSDFFGDSHYTVIKPKYAICENALTGSNTLNEPTYWSAGFSGSYSPNGSYNHDIFFNHICPANKACDQLSDEVEINTPNGVIPSPCRTMPNQFCTQNSDCLYNSCNTSTNECNVGIGIEGILKDEFGAPITNKQIKLTTCGSGDSVLKTSTTNSKGRFNFYHVPGNYKLKSSAPWSNEVTYVFPEGPCYSYEEGFHDIWLELFTEANIHGKAVNPQGFASTNLPFEAATCQNVTMDTDTTDSQGNFSLNSDAGYQKVLVTLNGTKFPLTDSSGISCLFQYGDVDLGTQVITDNCPLYDNTCSDDNTRLFDCKNDSVNGCSCKSQYCEAGCTENAPVCNPIGTGTFKVQVLDANGNAVPQAPVYVDYQFSGKTNGFGKKDVNVKHGSHTIKADCPSAPLSQTKPSYINSDTKYETFKLNCPTQQKGDLVVIVNDINGSPLVNVVGFLDNSFENSFGTTNVFGYSIAEELPFGKHDLVLAYQLDENSLPQQVSYTIDINSTQTTFTHTLLLPGQPGYSSYNATEFSPAVAGADDAVLVIGSTVVLYPIKVAEYCSCIQEHSDLIGAEEIENDCIFKATAFNATDGTNLKPDSPFRSFILDHAVTASQCEQPIVGVSKGVLETYAISKGVGIVAKIGVASYATIDTIVPVSKTLSGVVKAANEFKIVKVSKELAEYTKGKIGILYTSLDNLVFKPYTVAGISKLSYGGKLAMEEYLLNLGDDGVIYVNKILEKGFSKDQVANVYNGIGKIKSSDLPAAEYSKLMTKFIADSKGPLSSVQGIFGEVEAAALPKFISNISKYELDIGNGKIDWVLKNGDMLEIKSANIIATKTADLDTYAKKIAELAKQLIKYNKFNPTSTTRGVFTTDTTQNIKSAVYEDLKKEIIKQDSAYANWTLTQWEKIVVEGID
jgi:hypothetical protein